jgi:hypothetical protein
VSSREPETDESRLAAATTCGCFGSSFVSFAMRLPPRT